ncbi:uncharacterized protein LOC143149392 isoform X2 [Ptiloglossa arizonensis]|uniref:uncharacterized protein LOC143149392 isoform X2 n=1 Tax=Ptiloglossa arizonensis TaxID=3350558 RepID=UPI003F9EFC06
MSNNQRISRILSYKTVSVLLGFPLMDLLSGSYRTVYNRCCEFCMERKVLTEQVKNGLEVLVIYNTARAAVIGPVDCQHFPMAPRGNNKGYGIRKESTWVGEHQALVNIIGRDPLLPGMVCVILGGEKSWKTVVFLLEQIMLQEEIVKKLEFESWCWVGFMEG